MTSQSNPSHDAFHETSRPMNGFDITDSRRHDPISDIVGEGRLIVCSGPGGVGKTTTSAALGLRAAFMGRKVIVLTIDPARRLADSLGIGALTNEPSEIDLQQARVTLDRADRHLLDQASDTKTARSSSQIDSAGAVGSDEGELWAMMLDPKETFDDLIRRLAPDDGAFERSQENKVYQLLSSALHGIQEYAALEKLYDLYTGGDFDLIVLDTPPATNALEFLKAPSRASRFFDERILKWFLPDASEDQGFLGKVFNPGSIVLKLLSKLVGQSFVDELVDFFDTFQYVQEALKNRGDMIEEILRDPGTHFFVVTTADPRRIREGLRFHEKLDELGQEARAFIVNRVTPGFALEDIEALDDATLEELLRRRDRLDATDVTTLREQLEEHYTALAKLARRDRISVGRLADHVGEDVLQLVPVLGEDIHSLTDLLELSQFLTPSRPIRPQAAE